MSEFIKKKKIGEILIEMEVLTEEQLFWALEKQKETKELIGQILLQAEYITEEKLALALARQFSVDYVDLQEYVLNEELFERVPETLIKMYYFLPHRLDGNELTIITHDPTNISMFDSIQVVTTYRVNYLVGSRDRIEKVINDYFFEDESDSSSDLPDGKTLDDITLDDVLEDVNLEFIQDLGEEEVDGGLLDDLRRQSDQKPIIVLLNKIILQALADRASDIHIESMPAMVQVRYRIDGVLFDKMPIPKKAQNAIVSRVKIMSNLNIAERRMPQDGAFSVMVGNQKVDFRISLLPTIHGENVNMRILSKDKTSLNVRTLGFDDLEYDTFFKSIQQPHGIIMTTGPTGSGKTTTLYAALNEISSSEIKVITLEDPVEYQLPGIMQMQVHRNKNDDAKSFTFAKGLRSILRHDPDVVMLGEIRDEETAKIAVNAALTGHLVFSTIHANSAVSVVIRMKQMAIEPPLLASTMIIVIAQRLVRKICEHCKVQLEEFPEEELRLCEFNPDDYRDWVFHTGTGCDQCGHTGYSGRIGIYELFQISLPVREMICAGASAFELAQQADKEGMRTLKHVGMIKVQEGISSLDEVVRVARGAH